MTAVHTHVLWLTLYEQQPQPKRVAALPSSLS